MDYQVMFNLLYGAFAFLCGFLLNNLWNEMKSMQRTDKEIVDRVSAIETVVAGNYVTRAEFQHNMDKLFGMLNDISTTLGKKADR
jgi:hypothetical protein